MVHTTEPVDLPSGAIEDPLGKLAGYYVDSNYAVLYDRAIVLQDSALTIHDILISRMVDSGIGSQAAADLYARAQQINLKLEALPPTFDLTSVDVPAVVVADLVQTCCDVYDIEIARTTKVLHKKRPAYLPIIDSAVENRYREAATAADEDWPFAPGERAVAVMGMMRADLLSPRILGQIDELRCWLQETKGINVTRLRVLDVLIWSSRDA